MTKQSTFLTLAGCEEGFSNSSEITHGGLRPIPRCLPVSPIHEFKVNLSPDFLHHTSTTVRNSGDGYCIRGTFSQSTKLTIPLSGTRDKGSFANPSTFDRTSFVARPSIRCNTLPFALFRVFSVHPP